ncbi:MAG: helix-hairpin-helix domain-containing protein [Syntrophobacterales bacterium]|nr:MAG: helix-hairpin-helix domain-containing protein [Syntrophobacterales bacterium]
MRIYSPKQSWLLLSLGTLLLLASLFITLSERPGSDDILQGNPSSIAIEVAGETPNPGIYSFPTEVTVERALVKAGGIGRGKISNPQVLNNTLNAGSKIVVIRDAEHTLIIELARMEPEKCIVFSVPLNLNEVEEEDLTLIPGIGPRLAQRIIQYRSKKGGFRKIEELKDVRGIGKKKLRSLERYLIIPKG